ncbi:hypothetical protein Pmar_PMAR023768 [Perkinsus marinus ATCC 50983]|uniref:Uncharacterized protein n=1 Tax=Perkinsus marinus (strain ATCC 50983 / TXsc) TaxID=423536 RepID=C5KCH6_PERM5|nr:hypothetical protein Pmar_PMAR023768 [Perkinsus marinus ATCC 50983]EER17838.1 hypothetical protein Pmar_PMAR023768 [Perkinsus marinus ATCC 50983]|eukprot:XP_002786042.1 hypothetical protein Pmar_PMAR023768 [Perkinsus marinus ATCC 50983]
MAPKKKSVIKAEVVEPEVVENNEQLETVEPVIDPRCLDTGHMLYLLDDDIRTIWDAREVDRLSVLAGKITMDAADDHRKDMELQLYLNLIEHCSDQLKDGLCLTPRQTAVAHMILKMLVDGIRSEVEVDGSGRVVQSVEKTTTVEEFKKLALLYTIE